MICSSLRTKRSSTGEALHAAPALPVVSFVGFTVGNAVGLDVGLTVGLVVGLAVGVAVGCTVGLAVGLAVGFVAGLLVGAFPSSTWRRAVRDGHSTMPTRPCDRATV